MAKLVLRQGTFDLEFEVRESDPHTEQVMVRMSRISGTDKDHISDLFLSADQVSRLGEFLHTQGEEIGTEQAQAAYLRGADVESTR